MIKLVRLMVIAVIPVIPALDCRASCQDDDQEASHQLSLTDLANYSAALSGKPTAPGAKKTDLPLQVKFKDLWNHPDAYQGRRVTVEGWLMRTFRQGPLGTFPALAEAWITSPAGDPFCVVFPLPSSNAQNAAASVDMDTPRKDQKKAEPATSKTPEHGRMVRFTGTFLKMVRYLGADTHRLAPLIVGDGPPLPISDESVATRKDGSAFHVTGHSDSPLTLACLALGLVAAGLLALTIARRHLRGPISGARGRKKPGSFDEIADPPLEFIEPPREP